MKIKKTEGYDSYRADVSYAELMAIAAMGQTAGDPICDEISKSIEWHFAHEVPPPGMDEHPSKAAEKTGEPADELLASPPDSEVVPVPDDAAADGANTETEITQTKITPDVGGGETAETETIATATLPPGDEADRLLPDVDED